MAGSFAGVKCPVCENKFAQEDDIVVCPVCGTPYHRACYERAGRCVNQALHDKREAWSSEGTREREEQKYDGSLPLRCSKCGTVNPSEGIFCQICGCRLGEAQGVHANGGSQAPQPIRLNPFTTPYGGISPDEEIEGVSVRDIALFVGENSHYFIPKFKAISAKERMPAWNWPSFLFRGFYFLYRKMYLPGILLLLITVIANIPFASANFSVLSSSVTLVGSQLAAYNRIMIATNLASLVISLFCATQANRLYYKRVLSSIKKLRATLECDVYDQEYILALTKQGRTNRSLILVLTVILLLSSMLLSALLMMFAV